MAAAAAFKGEAYLGTGDWTLGSELLTKRDMGKLNIFKIELSQPRGVFYGGQWLQGYVCVELNAPMKMRGIRLTFYGGGKVSYVVTTTQSTGGSRSTHQRKDRTMYRSIEEYFNHTMYVFGAPDPSFMATNSPTLAAGRYHYPFQFLLPSWIPSSFEGAHGHVRYSLKAVIDKPWKFDHETRKLFTVVGMMDLNKIEDAPNPGEIQGEKTICCLCCASGPVGANLRVERKGFVPGENIFISGDVINNSSRRMKSVKIVIAQKVGFHAIECSRLQPTGRRHGGRSAARRHRVWAPCSHTNWSESEVVSINKGELAAGETLTLNQEALKVPPVPPSFLNGCGVIDIQYFLKAVLNPAGPSRKLEVPLKITIGTIPLRSLFPEYNEAARRAGHTTCPTLPQPPSAPPEGTASNYPPPDAPPPYFAESYEGRKQVKEEGQSEYLHGDTEWAPVYPYYDFHNTPAPGGTTSSTSTHGPPQSLPQTMQVPTIGFQPPTPEAESVSTGTVST